ncbi:alkaline phosphatase family protein [uncultured Paludibaculum sp.]|uniref:bifunctional YncE family protein/alkaline phosphatase family protein n=1 Tax=uncultured Paludibaculum sp. TaxID=1765020 RepID=UPI002AAAEDE4|nr:alkaline phosphatase family protein [uncultured Paludibaculum sp.]
MIRLGLCRTIAFWYLGALLFAQPPHTIPGGYSLPNGWRITPIGKAIPTEDLILNLTQSRDERTIIAQHGGFNPHGLLVIDAATQEPVQRIRLHSAWLGLAWSRDGSRLYVSGGNASGPKHTADVAPIYVFDYANGRLSDQPRMEWRDTLPAGEVYWTGLAMHPAKNLLYAANRGADPMPGHVSVFDTATGKVVQTIPVDVSPYDLQFNEAGTLLYVSNWSSDCISVIDVAKGKVISTIPTGHNPNDMELGADGRLYVSNGNENTVTVIDTAKRQPIETINVGPTARAPLGSTPNGLALDRKNNMLFVANADNNCIAVVNVREAGESHVLGFLPSGWYPSALLLNSKLELYVGNSKGLEPHANPMGPTSPLLHGATSKESVRDIQRGTVNIVSVKNLRTEIKGWTKQVYDNIPYKDDYLTMARPPQEPSIVPQQVGAGSPIKHVIYVIKENRTYDQLFGDIAKGQGDPRLAIFGEKVTPNHHAIAEQWVLLDNLYCDGEVSVDGHSWSNSAIATDYNEKMWPAQYGGHSKTTRANAYVPSAGHLWDLAARKGLTYRSYGEYASRASDGTTMDAAPGVGGLLGHVAPKFKLPGMRDTDNVHAFFAELDEFEKNFSSKSPNQRLPNFVVMSLPEDHTAGTRPGGYTPRAMVANADWAVGQLVERLTKSPYWPETALFIIEDDAQNGPDHVDARRTVGLVVSPYTKRNFVDSTLYTTSAMLRTMELLLGLPPMTQYDAAALPMYNSFRETTDLTAYTAVAPRIDVNERNTALAWGAKESMKMNLDEVDEAPMFALNEIIWKSVMGADSQMPLPVHRYWFQSRTGGSAPAK